MGGVRLYSRSLKELPNRHVQDLFKHFGIGGLDGELIVGDPTAATVFQASTSGVMSQAGEPDFTYHVFDYLKLAHQSRTTPYYKRLEQLLTLEREALREHHPRIKVVPQHLCHSPNDVAEAEYSYTAAGYEGIMLRDPDGHYKFGRSTVREGILLKVKQFTDAEAEVLEVRPLMRNHNEAKVSATGHLERSQKKAGLVAAKLLGSLVVRDLTTNQEFEIGTGFTELVREKLWVERAKLPGQIIKYKYQAAGMKEKPRFPVFIGFRHKDDLE